MIRGSILQDCITVLNMYASNSNVKRCEANTDRSARRNR